MIRPISQETLRAQLQACGLKAEAVRSFLQAVPEPAAAGGRADDARAVGRFCAAGRTLLGHLPLRSRRTPPEREAGEAIVQAMASAAWAFFGRWRGPIYDELTAGRTRALRIDELARAGAALLPGILPDESELAGERELLLKDKDGLELHQGLFFSQLLADRAIGLHLLAAMLRPTPFALEHLEQFQAEGTLDLGPVRVDARGDAGYLCFKHLRYLNAEDDETVLAQERACDLILLHPGLRMGVLRGDPVEHPRYKGRRLFSSGLNLTALYQGKLSFLFYVTRDLGLVNKFYRGLIVDDAALEAERLATQPESTVEKPWLAVVDGFAIGGGCQLLLVMDYVIAESGAYCSLPARKEGIIPGCANLRLPRFMGERMARQAIMFDRTFYVDSPDAAALINEVRARDRIDEAAEASIRNALGSGMVSAGGNRKALRVQTEPLDTLRAYMSTYALEQAFCHRSEQLTGNLERYWNATQRRL
jgi:thioesterase DpgC